MRGLPPLSAQGNVVPLWQTGSEMLACRSFCDAQQSLHSKYLESSRLVGPQVSLPFLLLAAHQCSTDTTDLKPLADSA